MKKILKTSNKTNDCHPREGGDPEHGFPIKAFGNDIFLEDLGRALVFAIALSVLCFTQPKDSFAEGRRSRPESFSHSSRFEYRRPAPFYRHLPLGCISLRIGSIPYFYGEGAYYQETPSGYVVVSAPMGAVVRALPERHRVIVYDNTNYYYYNSAYYVKQPEGYAVVTPPAPVVTQNAPAVEAPEKTVVVTVPNSNGSYMSVTLQKYSDGYTGPNGEFYPDYPTIEQLKAMYSKSSVAAEPAAKDEELSYDIPNPNGSFTRVKILKSKEGYVGPEGEFYPAKPTIEQLKKMYAKG